MRALMATLFETVTFLCLMCGAQQRVPLRHVHLVERFLDLPDHEAVVIVCSRCCEGVQIPTPYRSRTGQVVRFHL